MTSYTLQLQPRRQYTLQYSNERGPQGPAGSNATATTDANLLVSGTLADARLSSNVALENVANVFTAKQSFSGTTHSGLCLHSLTSAEYNALTPANGDLFRDSTTDRVDARLARGTVELVDTAGGQTINGALTVSNGVFNVRKINNNSDAIASFQANNLTQQIDIGYQYFGVSGSNTNIDISVLKKGTNGNVWLGSGTAGQGIRFNADDSLNTVWFGARNVGITANTGQSIFLGQTSSSTVGVSIATATGNLTASGTVTGSTILVGGASGPLLKNSSGQIQSRNNADTADASFRSGTYHLGSDLGLHPVGGGASTASVFWKFRIFGNCGSTPINFPGTGNLGNGFGNNSCHCEIVGTAAAVPILDVLAVSGQTAPLQRWLNSAGTVLASVSSAGSIATSGTLQVGGGTIVANILSATATLDFPSIAANSFADLTITVTGAVVGDTVSIGVPNGSVVADVSFSGWVSAANTVTVRATNDSATTALDPASGTFRATVIRF